MIRVLIVDDEAWARKRIVRLLKGEPDVEIIAECENGVEAIERIGKDAPDLVFLDVQMPEVNGFEVIDAIDSERAPLLIFATAYDKYALRAFDAHAFDYLLKPFEEQRFREALNRAREELRRPRDSSEPGLRALLASLRQQPGYVQRLAIKTAGRMIFLKASDIDWAEASGNYVTLHVGQNTHLLRTTMTDFVSRLNADQFVRIHRSTVVNLDRIQEVMPWFHGEQLVKLKDGTELTVGRAFRRGLAGFLANAVE
jgi:two-component system, LytTR family, response regulator